MRHSFTKNLLSLSLFVLLCLQACKPSLIAPDPDVGLLDVARFIAVGDGYTAGFSNTDFRVSGSTMGLYEDAQLAAFPRILALQMSLDTKASPDFEQFLASDAGSGYTKLKYVHGPPCPFLDPVPEYSTVPAALNWSYNSGGPDINNLGVPYLSLVNPMMDSTSLLFFKRINSLQATDYPELIREHNPTAFTLWMGTRDLLNYAMRGGDPSAATLPSPEAFAEGLRNILEACIEGHPQSIRGVVGNIPNIIDFPFFTSIDRVFITVENCSGTENPIYIETPGMSQEVSVAQEKDRILLPAAEYIGTYYGNGSKFGLLAENPIPDNWVLDQMEIDHIKQHISAYNIVIDTVLDNINSQFELKRLTIADLKYLFEVIDRGIIEDGLSISGTYLTGGVFGLDGIFLTPRGNALVANEFIRTINKFRPFRAALPPVDVTDYPGVVFP